MRFFHFLVHSKYFHTFWIGTTIGILIGSATFSVLVSYRMEQYHHTIRQLEALNEDKDSRLRKLEESINQAKFVLKRIEIFLEYEGDELNKIALEKTLKEKLNTLLGKEVGNIDVDLVTEVIDKRIMKLQDKEYRIKLKKLILADVLKIWAEADELE